MGDLIK